MLAARVVAACVAGQLAAGFISSNLSADAKHSNCTNYHSFSQVPALPQEIHRVTQIELNECKHCNGVCPAEGFCRVCQQDQCDPEMISRIWQNVPDDLRMLPNDIAKHFFKRSTVLVLVGDSIMRQQYRALQRIMKAASEVEQSSNRMPNDRFTYWMNGRFLKTVLSDSSWTFADVDLKEVMETAGEMWDGYMVPEQVVIFFGIGAHYNNLDLYAKELRDMMRQSGKIVKYLREKWHIPVKLIFNEPSAQHFPNGDYKEGDQCAPVCTMNPTSNKRQVTFRQVLRGLGEPAKSHFQVFQGYGVTDPFFFAHSSPVGRCPSAPNDCTHYCHAIWYFWVSALSRSHSGNLFVTDAALPGG